MVPSVGFSHQFDWSIDSQVAVGQAKVMARQLEYFAGASSCGVIVGARVPIALAMRTASVQSHLLSAIFAGKIADRFRTDKP